MEVLVTGAQVIKAEIRNQPSPGCNGYCIRFDHKYVCSRLCTRINVIIIIINIIIIIKAKIVSYLECRADGIDLGHQSAPT